MEYPRHTPEDPERVSLLRHSGQHSRGGLAAGDNLVLPQEVVEFLDRLRALGVDERIVQVERDGWIPLAAHSPERVPEWMARKRKQIAGRTRPQCSVSAMRKAIRDGSVPRTSRRS